MSHLFFNLSAILSSTWVLFLSLFVMLLGNGLQGSLLSIRGNDEGFSTLALAWVSSGFYIGYFAGSMVVPNFLKRVGYIRVFAALVAIASVAAIAYPMYIDQYYWITMRVVTGFCFAGIYMITESWLNSQTNNENRAKVLGIYVIIIFMGMSLGQLLLTIASIDSYFLFALASIIISLAAVPLLLTSRQAPIIDESSHLSLTRLFKRSPLGTVSVFFTNFVNGGIIGISAIYATTIHMPTEQIALFVSSAYIGVIILQFPIGLISDRIDRRKMIILLCLLSTAISLIMMQIQQSGLMILLFGLLGGLSLPLYAVCIAYVNDRLRPEEILPATSTLLKISGIANMIAPLMIGYLMVKYGEDWFFGALAGATTIVAVFGVYRVITGADLKVEDMGEFIPLGVTTTAATMSLAHEGTQLAFDFDTPQPQSHNDEQRSQQ